MEPKKRRTDWLIWVAVAIVPFALYCGAYWLLAKPGNSSSMFGRTIHCSLSDKDTGDDVDDTSGDYDYQWQVPYYWSSLDADFDHPIERGLRTIFRPAHLMDRHLRPGLWGTFPPPELSRKVDAHDRP